MSQDNLSQPQIVSTHKCPYCNGQVYTPTDSSFSLYTAGYDHAKQNEFGQWYHVHCKLIWEQK